MSTLATSIQHSLQVLTTILREEKAIYVFQIGKEDDKLPLFADKIILYT